MPGARARTPTRDAGRWTARLALILVGLLLTIAPSASAARTTARHGRSSAPAASCPGADVPASGGSGPASAAAVLCLINQQRATYGLPGLRENPQLDHAAQTWTNTMARIDSFSHGTNFTGRIDAVGYDWQDAGENIAAGYATPRQVVTAWMASPDHCRNILDPSYADVGTGVLARRIPPYGPSIWTQDFGLTMNQNAPSSNTGPMNACPYGG